MELLTAQAVADLKGCSARYIQSLVKRGTLPHEEGEADNGRLKYLIPLAALDLTLQRKWYSRQTGSVPPELRLITNDGPKGSTSRQPVKSLEDFTIDQREQITWWSDLLKEWQKFRSEYEGPLSEADEEFILLSDFDLSVKTLYRRWTAYKSNDLDGLVDKRGQYRKGQSSIHPDVWREFLSYYLDQSFYPIADCVKYAQQALKQKKRLQLLENYPSYSTFYKRVLSDIPAGVGNFNRKGFKSLHDRYAPYIRRLYDKMLSNDYWVADNYPFDIMSEGPNGRPHRMYLTAIIDARSTTAIGWFVTPSPCGDATLCALRRGIQPPGGKPSNGLPNNFYVDNGSEFLVHDIGGRGHRKRKRQQEEFEPPPILKRLGINMVNAIPGNPEAKLIERVFLDIKDDFCRAFESFCGGSINERPERLNKILKSGKIPTDKELAEAVDEWIEGYYNHLPYGGSVVRDRGKAKIQVYNENLARLRLPASEKDLNLMMMRSSRLVKVGRRGVKLNIAGYVIDYWTPEFLLEWQDKKVYYRYDPDDLSSVRIYNDEDKFVCTVPADDVAVMEYGADKETIKGGMKKIGKYNKIIKEWTNGKILDINEKISVVTLMSMQAKENIENPPDYMRRNHNIVEFIQASEDTYEYPMAVGDDSVNLSNMIDAVKQRQNKEDTGYDHNE